jgi:hypothetical protein
VRRLQEVNQSIQLTKHMKTGGVSSKIMVRIVFGECSYECSRHLQKRTGQKPSEVVHKYELISLSLVDHEEQG